MHQVSNLRRLRAVLKVENTGIQDAVDVKHAENILT